MCIYLASVVRFWESTLDLSVSYFDLAVNRKKTSVCPQPPGVHLYCSIDKWKKIIFKTTLFFLIIMLHIIFF